MLKWLSLWQTTTIGPKIIVFSMKVCCCLCSTYMHLFVVLICDLLSDEWNFHILPQPPHFRGSSVAHGVNNQGRLIGVFVTCCSEIWAMSHSFCLFFLAAQLPWMRYNNALPWWLIVQVLFRSWSSTTCVFDMVHRIIKYSVTVLLASILVN
jgi:hypothetical protein